MLVVVVALRGQHRAVGVHEANGSEGRVEDLAHEMNIGLVGIEVERRCTDFQCVLAGNDGAGTDGDLAGPIDGHVLASRLQNVLILIRNVAGGRSRRVRSMGGRCDNEGCGADTETSGEGGCAREQK